MLSNKWKMVLNGITLFLILFFCGPLLAFPIEMKTNWKAKFGKHLNYNDADPEWKEIPELTFWANTLTPYPDSNIVTVSLIKNFTLSEKDVNDLDRDVAVRFLYISNVFEIYLNGELIESRGKIESSKILRHGARGNVIHVLPAKLLRSGMNTIHVIISGYHDEEIALYGDAKTSIDLYENHKSLVSERINLILLSLYFFVGLYHFLLYSKRKVETYNLYFALFCIFASTYLYTRTNSVYELNLDSLVQTKIEFIVLFFTSITMGLFFESFLTGKIQKPGRIYLIFILVVSLIVAIASKAIASTVLLVWQLSCLLLLGYLVFLMVKAVRMKNTDARTLTIGFFSLVATLIVDLFGAMHIIKGFDNLELSKYGFFAFVTGIAAMLANRFLRVHNEVEELNASLEHKVELRTAELQETLSHVQKLKFQQDGDYFLTSLLIKPLMINEVTSNQFTIEFFIKQKKTFEFKNRTYEIGGDICIANDIVLKGKKYCVFVNGDAMGKSIQGAGGALVLGVVFRSVITRTRLGSNSRSPEQWLKNCFTELQNVFLSFDGSMLISVVMGLAEENTGMVYYINAEHPWVVLYRDGVASFLEDSLYLRKIGMTEVEGNLRVKTFQMLAHDSLILGSDGRDDILISKSETGERVINEDENLFLRNVEWGSGDLKKITEKVISFGELTDDYTLVKITYQPMDTSEPIIENEEEYYQLLARANFALENKNKEEAYKLLQSALEIKKDNKETLKKLIHVMFNLKLFKELVPLCKRYLDLEPSDTEHMFILSSAHKLCNQFEESIELGESLRLREPENVKNLINLSDTYRLMKNLERSKKMLGLALERDPENDKAIKLKNLIDSIIN